MLLLAALPPAQGQATATEGSRLVGAARLSVFGFDIYNARLWVDRGFRRERYAEHGFTLELAYLRDFEGAAIAQRSIREMRRIEDFSDEQASRWQAEMTRLFPNVARGDRITGIHQPGEGLRFLYNDKPLGVVRDPAFARVFMGIWLSPRTSEPAMRERLLAEVAP